MKEMNFSRREMARENNGILKETTTPESHSKGISDIEKEDKLVWEHKEDTIMSVDQLDKMYSPQDEIEASKYEIKNPVTGKRVHQRPFCDIIGKREQRKEKLEKMEGDLRERLDMLECSMSAVMVWNICKMSQGAPVCKMRRILEKQFKDTRELSCRSTPSCHYDRRVREIEAERKLALKKTEEARTLWSEKLATLEQRKRKLEEAKRIQEEQKNAMERLNEEAKALRETIEKKAMETDESCQYGECGDTQCKTRWLDRVSSVTSIESEDIQCLEKLQQLAEEEVIIKRGIAELERREEAYMRTLQQADELWSKMEGDATSALQEQVDMKIAANQQLADRVCELEDALEKCRARLTACRAELEKFLSIEKVEATIGRDDDFAKVTDKVVMVKAKVVHRPIGRVDDIATVEDGEVLARVEVADEEALAKVETVDKKALARVELVDEETLAKTVLIDADAEAAPVGDDKYVLVKPDLVDLAVDRPADLVQIEDAESIVRPEDITYEQKRLKKIREYLTKLGSLEELYKDGEPCAPDFVCNDVVTSPTGMTDEELIALGVDPSKKLDGKLVADEEEHERQFREELAKETNDVEDIEKKEKKIDDISGVEIEKKIVTEAKEQIIEAIDVPVKEIEMRQEIQEVMDDKSITIPNDVRAEIKKIETDQDIVIQRDTILSWIDMIDTIRTSAAKHPDCHIVKEDADILIEQVGAHVGIRPKKVEEEHVTIVENKREKVIEKNELKMKGVIIETKLQDELIVPKYRKMEPEIKNESIPSIPSPEETSVEVKTPMEPVAELPTLTKEEISVGIEPPTTLSIENFFQSPTIPVKEDLKSVPSIEPVSNKIEIEKKEIKEETQAKEIVHDTKEIEISQVKEDAFEDLIDKKLTTEMVNDKKINSTDKEKTLIVEKIEKEEEIISDHVEKNEKKVEDVPIKEAAREKEKIIVEEVRINKILPVSEEIDESKHAKDVEKLKEIPQVDKMADRKETRNAEVVETEKISEIPPVVKITEVEPDVEETLPTIDVTEIKIMPEIVSPTVDLIEREKIEPSELPIIDIKEPISDVVREKVIIEEAPLIMNETEELLILNAISEKKVEIEEPSTTDMIPKRIEIEEALMITDTVKEITEVKEPTEEIITEKEIEIQPVPEPMIQKEMEEIEEITKLPVPEIEIEKDEELEEMPTKIIPPIKLFEEREKEEIPESVEKEEILAKIALPTKLIEDKKKKEPVEEKKPELVEIKPKIAEIKPDEIEMPAIPIDPRLFAQPYLIIAQIKEKELLQIVPPTKLPCTECCTQPPVMETAQRLEIMQTNVAQTEVGQTKVVQTEIVETEIMQVTAQPVSAPKSPRTPPLRVISEYLKQAELKASSSTEIADDRPEITGRKILWRKRLKDQSTVTTASIGSQTDKTSHVSHDRVIRDERERARVTTDELLRSIKIAAGLARPDAEREIRTINYGGRSDETGKLACNCCQCGKISTPPSTRPKLKVRPQIDAKTATPSAVDALKRIFIPPKIDRPISYDRLCPDCKAKIQSRMPHEKHHIEKIVEKISRDLESCGCSSIDKSCRAPPRKREIEKKDQGCLAKMPKRKTNLIEQKRKDHLQSSVKSSEKFDVEPLSPSCICYKLEKISAESIRKGNCYCAD